MAEEIEALIATDIRGGGISGDKVHAIFKFDSLNIPFAVALPPEKLCHLVSVCAKLIALEDAGLGASRSVQTLTLRGSEVAKAANGALALSLEQEGGGRLTYALRPDEALVLLKKLAIALEIAGPKSSNDH
jgi:hypothetical protein